MDSPKGNTFLFYIFMVSNSMLLLIGFGTMAAGIYVAAALNRADWYNISFIGLGFLTVLVFMLGCRSKTSLTGSCLYLLATLAILLAQLSFTLAIIFYTDFEVLIGSVNANAVRYSLLGSCGVLLTSFLLGWWYRNSMMMSRYYYEGDPLGKDRGSPLFQELSKRYKG